MSMSKSNAGRILDFRSDTLTKPTAAMRAAMAAAEVGDDVFHEDPTVERLQGRIAGMLGKEAALFVPSGTMSNQIGLRLHCGPGDEFLCESGCHIFNNEQAAYAQLSGIAAHPIQGRDGLLTVEDMSGRIRSDKDHCAITRLLALEITHNSGGGRIPSLESVAEICRWAHDHGLATHLDGARLFNAVVATGIPAADWAAHFDSVSVCFSKGLGAPVGSAIIGTREMIGRARRHRKAFGGGMRQAGVIAAGALYALDHNIDRLAEDHANARRLADFIRETDGLSAPEKIDSNIVIFRVEPRLGTAKEFVARLKELGMLVFDAGPQSIRAVTHLDVNRDDVEAAKRALQTAAEHAARAAVSR